MRNKSTEQFSGLPYIYSLLNCLICLWYGMPVVSPGVILVATVNSIGAVFQLIYVSIFISYADKAKKVFSFALAWSGYWNVIFNSVMSDSARFFYFLDVVPAKDVWTVSSSFCSVSCHSLYKHKIFWIWCEAGFCWISECCFSDFYVCFTPVHHCKFIWKLSSVLTFRLHIAFPLMCVMFIFMQKLVIKTRSVEFMPFYLSLSTFLMSLSFFAYGLFKDDPFIYVSITLLPRPS